MSTHQQSKPRAANQSITELSGRPGTCRSKVGCDAMDEPCTNRMVPAGPEGSGAYFSNRNRRASPFWVQCSSPRIAPDGVTGLFMRVSEPFIGHAANSRATAPLVGWVEQHKGVYARLRGLLRNPSRAVQRGS